MLPDGAVCKHCRARVAWIDGDGACPACAANRRLTPELDAPLWDMHHTEDSVRAMFGDAPTIPPRPGAMRAVAD